MTLFRIVLLLLIFFSSTAFGQQQVQQTQQVTGQLQPQPRDQNVLIILADDIGREVLASYGATAGQPFTPVIDSLAEGGVLFRSAWATPLCSPTRACVLTGRYPFRHGIGDLIFKNVAVSNYYDLQASEITIPEMLDLGTGCLYSHAAFGKWHLCFDDFGPNEIGGFSHFSGTPRNLIQAGYASWIKNVNGEMSTSTAYPATDKVNDAIKWINSASEPWVVYLSFNLAHKQWHVPPVELYYEDLSLAGPPSEDPVPHYRAMAEAMDTEIGRLFSSIGSVMNRTTVIFIGDNGTPSQVAAPLLDPEHAKKTLYEGGVGVPFIVSGPLVKYPGSESTVLVHVVDIFPTVAQIAGVNLNAVIPSTTVIDGISLVPYLENPAQASLRQTMVTERFLPCGASTGIALPLPMIPHCQENFGYGGPGTVSIAMCGFPLVYPAVGDLSLTGAPPFAQIDVYMGNGSNLQPLFGGTVVTQNNGQSFLADVNGDLFLPGFVVTNNDSAGGRKYIQALVVDATMPQGIAISNALKVELLPYNGKAIRDERYKLITSVNGDSSLDELYDLQNDPGETTNLLGIGSPAIAQVYADLKQALAETLNTP